MSSNTPQSPRRQPVADAEGQSAEAKGQRIDRKDLNSISNDAKDSDGSSLVEKMSQAKAAGGGRDFKDRASDDLVAEAMTGEAEDEVGRFDGSGWKTGPKDSKDHPLPPSTNANKTGHQLEHSNLLQKERMAKQAAEEANDFNLEELQAGVLPDVLMTMRQKIESLTLFDSDMIRMAQLGPGGGGVGPGGGDPYDDEEARESKEQLRRSFQQSISAAVLVSLAHKRYERRRLAAMEIEKVVRSLVNGGELDRVRAILLLLSDDYVRSTSEDARKGGVVALAASGIGLKKADEASPDVKDCRDLILASVVHACQDHSQRVRYYATESLFNVVKVLPSLAVQHFFILFEILRSLYADVDLDVRSGAELLDKKLKEVIVGAINSGQFTADACVPLFARFVHMKNKPTKRLTLTWLQVFVEKLFGNPILEFLHLFLGGVFAMVADPNQSIRELSLSFLQSVLPKLLENNEDFEDGGDGSTKVDFDKVLQSLVTTMEHPDPFVRKVAMYWMSRIVQAHIGNSIKDDGDTGSEDVRGTQNVTSASMSVRNSLPHVLPGILLSIGDETIQGRHATGSSKDSFLPEQTTHVLAEMTNDFLQDAVRRHGSAYVSHLDGFIVALHEELDTGVDGRNPPAIDRRPYRLDVKGDGSGIESTGWFRSSAGTYDEQGDAAMMSRRCALEWIIVLYEYVVPDSLKAEYAREFITPIIHQLVYEPPEPIVFKSLEVLAKITVPVKGEKLTEELNEEKTEKSSADVNGESNPMTDSSAQYALDILDASRCALKSRDRQVFACLIHLHSKNHHLLSKLSTVIEYMCELQPPEFVFVSFALELDRYFVQRLGQREAAWQSAGSNERKIRRENAAFALDLEFVSSFVKQMNNVLLNSRETGQLRELLSNSIGAYDERGSRSARKARLFHILIHAFAHNLAATLSLCLWGGAYLTASTFLHVIDPLDVNLMYYLEVDDLIELLERPLFRNLHLLMLECDTNPKEEGSSAMLFETLKSLLMLIPQSSSYSILKDRLLTISQFRRSATHLSESANNSVEKKRTEVFVDHIKATRMLHNDAKWRMIRAESLEAVEVDAPRNEDKVTDEAKKRRDLLGYANEADEIQTKKRIQRQMSHRLHRVGEDGIYDDLRCLENDDEGENMNFVGLDEKSNQEANGLQAPDDDVDDRSDEETAGEWKAYWTHQKAEA